MNEQYFLNTGVPIIMFFTGFSEPKFLQHVQEEVKKNNLIRNYFM